MRVALAIPTYNSGQVFKEVSKLISMQKKDLEKILIVDSSSKDSTVEIAKNHGFETVVIPKDKFSHGGTRSKIAKEMYSSGYDYLIFMTHDVFLQPDAIKELITFMINNPKVGVARGKQEVDLKRGNIFEYFARQYNYGEKEVVYYKNDILKYGIDTIYTSDAFSIYNLEALKSVAYFGDGNEVSEDMLAAHKLIQAGYGIGYAAKAKVYHTHNYSILDEYRRYVPIGNFYRTNDSWISLYGKTNSKGISLVIEEIQFLIKNNEYTSIPYSICRNIFKFIGFKIGNIRRNKNV